VKKTGKREREKGGGGKGKKERERGFQRVDSWVRESSPSGLIGVNLNPCPTRLRAAKAEGGGEESDPPFMTNATDWQANDVGERISCHR